MKQLLLYFFLLTCTSFVFAQDHIFVLVDVSTSIKEKDLNGARQALIDVLLGMSPTNATIAYGITTDLANFKLKSGDKLSILKFGNKATILNNSILPSLITNIPADVHHQINSSFPTSLSDNRTYITFAKAKVAEYAKNNLIKDYKLYIVTDNITDDFGSNGKPEYTNDERSLVESYGTTVSGITEEQSTKLKLSNAVNKDYVLEFIPKVDISKYNLPGGNPPPTPTITFSSFAEGKKDKPKLTNANSFTLSWNCNCSTGTIFNVSLTEIDGGRYKDSKKNLTTNSVKFTDVPSGKFKIVVSGTNANSAITFIETPSNSFGWILLVLMLSVASGIGYYLWNKKRQEKIDSFTSNKPEDLFSKGNNSGSSGNSDYF